MKEEREGMGRDGGELLGYNGFRGWMEMKVNGG